MAIQYNGNTMGVITIDQKGNEFELQIRQGNCLAVIIHSDDEPDGTFTHILMQFFADEEHLKRICEQVDKRRGNSSAIDKMYATRYPLYVVDSELNNIIQDLLEEYGADRGWDEGWWFEDYEIDGLLFKIAK